MLKRFLSYYKPHRTLVILDLLAAFGASTIAVLYPMVTRYMLANLEGSSWKMVVAVGAILLGVYLLRLGMNFFMQYQGHMMGVRMQAQMRSELFRHLQKLPFRFFDENETGKIMTRMTSDLFDVSELAHHGPENTIVCGISVILSFVYLATIHLPLALITFVCVPLLVVVSLVTSGRMRKAYRRSREANAQISADIQSSVSGIRITKAFNNAKKEEEKFEKGNVEFQESRREGYKAMAQFHSTTTFIMDLFNVVIFMAGGLFLYRGTLTFADYSAFIVSTSLFLTPIKTMVTSMEQFQEGAAGFERFLAIMDIPEEQDDPGAEPVERMEGHIQLKDVSYGYDTDQEVLSHIDLNIPKGETFALVGPSGGGKTTICHLLPRFYDIQSGQILLDGKPIESITRESLRQNIGIVQQDIFLFNASIRDNILYGRLDATEAEVIEAAKRANIHDDIMSMEQGYDTIVGERGVRLSGGQKQRIAIARVFLKNPPILILDEATSALDNTTEILIQQALDQLCVGRTTLVVAHRLSTIKGADEIAVISGGEIVEQGDHESLLARNGAYAQLYRLQFREQLEA